MNLKTIVLSLCVASSISVTRAESKFTPSENKHDIRLSVSDGTPLTITEIFGGALSDGLLGSKRTDEKMIGVFGLGYRYNINRFRVGGDLGFALQKDKLTLSGQNTPAVQERKLNFMILPTAEFIYFKRNLVELYGSASAGVNLCRESEKALNDEGKEAASKNASLSTTFAYQINPIAVRVGNDRVGGFVEAGFGTKGFVTAGISVGF